MEPLQLSGAREEGPRELLPPVRKSQDKQEGAEALCLLLPHRHGRWRTSTRNLFLTASEAARPRARAQRVCSLVSGEGCPQVPSLPSHDVLM